jgi:hypothetical protein
MTLGRIQVILGWKVKMTFERGVALFVILNLADAASTNLLLHLGLATEANPLMNWAYTVSPSFFWVIKVILSCGGLIIIGRQAKPEVALSIVRNANLLYGLILSIHLSMWITYLLT